MINIFEEPGNVGYHYIGAAITNVAQRYISERLPSFEVGVLMTVDGQWYDGKSKADFGQLERATLASRDEIIASAPACAVDEVQDP